MAEFSRITIAEYLPIIKSIFASFEVQDKHFKGSTDSQRLSVSYLEKEYGLSKIGHAMRLIGVWLEGSDFESKTFHFFKANPEAKWSDMLRIIEAKILEYSNNLPVIVLVLFSSGRITREVNGTVLKHDFANDKLKAKILSWLPDDGSYLETRKLAKMIESKSDGSVRKTTGKISKDVGSRLQLPKQHPLIDSKRGPGYRINPIYNIVRVK